MTVFGIAAILLTIAALFGVINYHVFRLPQSIGILAITLVSSLCVLIIDLLIPGWQMREILTRFLSQIDLNKTLMHGMLSFLLFAGALHVDINDLLENKWTIGLLASLSVIISTSIVGFLAYGVFQLINISVPFIVCLCFGALISPTDPIAVLGILKDLKVGRSLEAKIAGESLFNDGFGVVLFSALVGIAGLGVAGGASHSMDGAGIVIFLLREVMGGALIGLGMGALAYGALKSIDNVALELLITLSTVMFGYSVSLWVHASGPIAMVIAGLFIGNHGKRFAMSEKTTEHIDSFWSLLDEILNAVLFLILGLEVFAVQWGMKILLASILVVPIVLLARWVSVSFPILLMRWKRQFSPGVIPILTWGGLRGGISVALILSLPAFEMKELLLTCTYAVVLFSILVQGLTVHKVLSYYVVKKL